MTEDPFKIAEGPIPARIDTSGAYRTNPGERAEFNKKWFDVYWSAREDGASINDAKRCAKEYS